MNETTISFIGGGNMAGAIIGGLLRQGQAPESVQVLEPWDEQRDKLHAQFPGVLVSATVEPHWRAPALVVWAVKPQTFKEAARAWHAQGASGLHLSVAAGIGSDSIARWLGSERVVRAMPNTPALVGMGMTGLYARPAVAAADRALVERVVGTTGDALWVAQEAQLDAVTALSGSGPAYVFYFLEAMRDAGVAMGLAPDVAQRLAMGTFAGATALAQRSDEPLQVLRERVTSKGGTTHAALSALQHSGVQASFEQAMWAAHRRAGELSAEFGS